MTVGARVCLIRQPAGLGDIILCQKIAHFFIRDGYEVWWPVIEEYYDTVNNYMKTTGINFCRQTDDYPLREHFELDNFIGPAKDSNDNIYLPLQRADRNYPSHVSDLKSKYFILNMDPNNWQDYFKFTRNKDKEDRLFYDVLELKDDMEYAFVNRWYASPPDEARKNFKLDVNCHVIEMSIIDGYTLFDWCKVIEQASKIHCVDTGLFYIIDMLKLKAESLDAYSKFDYPNPFGPGTSAYLHIAGLFKALWNYNEWCAGDL